MTHPLFSSAWKLLRIKPKRLAASLLSRFKFDKSSENSILSGEGETDDRRAPFRPDDETLRRTRQTLERILTENIIPFWYPGLVDSEDGGYRLNHDLAGKWLGPSNKFLVTQARTVWFFSRLAGSRYGGAEHLKAARHGYEFLRDCMWDKKCGGFYWEVDSAGSAPARAEKQVYGQAFGLYALTEYAKASGDAAATAVAKELFALFETKAHDERHGGYRDLLRRDWSPMPPPATKRMNTHLHMMEALTTYVAASKDPTARARLVELIFVNSHSVVRKDIGACREYHRENWQPLSGRRYDRVSYGHDVENVWLVVEACRAAGVSAGLVLDICRTIFRYALQYGFDRRDGGFFSSGPLNAPADRREKIWWVQAEALVAALQMHRLTGDAIYWDYFSRTLKWIVERQADWQHGDWHDTIGADGSVSGVKAGPWKCPYHQGRAMLQCLDLLPSM
jgi:mannose/cellobiose epimerase-like protein (N-acyl-D-glucosamine 2-epimerase family)